MPKKPKSDKQALAKAVEFIYNLCEYGPPGLKDRCAQCPLNTCMAFDADMDSPKLCKKQITQFFKGTFKFTIG